MKKCYYFLLVLVFLFTSDLNSQIKLGLQIGPNFTSGSYSSVYYTSTEVSGKTGLLAGFLAEFKLSDMFYLQPEINYLQKGVELSPLYYYEPATNTATLVSGSTGDFKLDFVEIPINVIAKFGKDQLKPFLFAGPSFNFLTTAEKTEKYSDYGDIGPYSIKDYMEKIDVAINLGGGIEYAINPKLDVFAMLRYSIGLTDLFKEGTITYDNYTYDYGDIEEFKTSGLAIAIGFKFCFSGCDPEPEAALPVKVEVPRTPIGRVPVKEFDLAKYDIPFYVSGYYRPNTQQSLDELFVLREGDLKNATYIEKFEKKSQRYDQYRLWAQSVDNIFHVVYTSAVDEIFPKINAANDPDEVLEISVTGYSDPRAITGKYWEPEIIQFMDTDGKIHMVKQGDDLDNLILSGLRAYHCGKLLDRLFSESSSQDKSDYEDLKKNGKIRYKYIGAGVAKDDASLEAQRRIKITMVRTDK